MSAFAQRKRQGKAQEKRQGDRAQKHHVRKANLEKHVTAVDRMRRSASDLASPGPPPPPVTPASPAAKLVTALASPASPGSKSHNHCAVVLGQRFRGSNHIRRPRRACRTRCG